MKKRILLILSLITFVLFIGGAKASTLKKNQSFTQTNSAFGISGFYYVKDGDEGYGLVSDGWSRSNISKYRLSSTEADVSNRAGYCLDPNADGITTLKVKRILGVSTDGEGGGAYDAGLLAILENGYNGSNNSFTFTDGSGNSHTVSGDSLEMATSAALRAFHLGYFNYDRKGSDGKTVLTYDQPLLTSIINQGAIWGSWYPKETKAIVSDCSNPDYDGAKILECLNTRNSNYYDWYKKDKNYLKLRFIVNGTAADETYWAAARLFGKGVEAAYNFKQNGSNNAVVRISESQATLSENQDEKTITINVTNLSSDGYLRFKNINCPTCSAKGITLSNYQYYNVTSKNWETLNSSIDLHKNIDNSGNIKIKFLVNKSASFQCDGSASYTFNYDFYDPTLRYTGAIIHDPKNPSAQRFVILIDNKDSGSGSNDGNSSYNGHIDCKNGCTSTITAPICDTAGSEKSKSNVIAPTEITRCILNNSDEAGNSYQLTTQANVTNNPYCQIYCKEDYTDVFGNGRSGIELNPITEEVNCGAKITLKAHVEGKKDCYTSGGADNNYAIDTARFTSDLIAAQRKMIEGYDNILKAAAAKSGSVTSTTHEEKDDDGNVICSYTSYTLSGTYQGVTAGAVDANGRVSVTTTTNSYSYSNSGSYNNSTKKCTNGTSDFTSDINSLESSGRDALSKGQSAYSQAIGNFNSCTNGWTNEYNINEKIKFAYGEDSYYNLLLESQKYLDVVESSKKTEEEVEICTGSINDKYECLSGRTTVDGAFSNKTFTTCTVSGCTSDTKSISNAKYVRKTVKKSQDYITPTVFSQLYPTGTIIATTEKGESLGIIENALPISPNTMTNVKFSLKLQDFGEFYDKPNEYGRIYDFNGENEASSIAVKQGIKSSSFDQGDYTCYIDVTCQDCPGVCKPYCIDSDGNIQYEPAKCPIVSCIDCEVKCINCLFNYNELQLNVKTISTTEIEGFDENIRNFGYNWTESTNVRLKLTSSKAQEAKKEISELNEQVYSENNLAFSIKMTPTITKIVQSYNNDNVNKGGYANSSLVCYDYDGYKNLLCYSKFIDSLLDLDEVKREGLINVTNRDSASTRNESNINADGYWQLYSKYSTIKISESVIGGPAWR